MRRLDTYLLVALSLLFAGSKTQKHSYNFEVPSKSIELPKALNEISGLQWISDSIIACVQDEKAKVFYLNSNSGKIESSFDFGKNGDFEGIAINADTTFILRSDGYIFISENGRKAKKYKFKNSDGFNFEGMCLDAVNNQLLIACKEHGNKKKRDSIFIYSFSTLTKKYNKEPIYKILRKKIHPEFMASGIALNPNGDIYVISANSKTLMVLKPNGTIKSNTQLNQEIFNQPEGICFDKKGNLYISNEKTSNPANLLRIDYK